MNLLELIFCSIALIGQGVVGEFHFAFVNFTLHNDIKNMDYCSILLHAFLIHCDRFTVCCKAAD